LATGEISKNETPIFVMSFHTSGAAGQKKNGQSDQKRNVKKRRSKYGKNRNEFSSLKENWTGSSGQNGLRPKGLLAEGQKNPVNPV
jgi:hypothetical protein